MGRLRGGYPTPRMEGRTCPRPSVVIPRAPQITACLETKRKRASRFSHLINCFIFSSFSGASRTVDHPNPKEAQHDYHGHYPSFRLSLPRHLESFGFFTQISYAHYTLQLVILITHTPPIATQIPHHLIHSYFAFRVGFLQQLFFFPKVREHLTSLSFERAFCPSFASSRPFSSHIVPVM